MLAREKTTNNLKIKENNKEEERTMRNKKGISLIVLVITIIVMIILAAAVIISLSNSGVINRANQAVEATNLAEVQHLASLAWSEAYLDNMNLPEEERDAKIKESVEKAFTDNNLNASDYNLTYGAGGVTVVMKETTTLGSLITNPKEDYGKKVNYSVKVGDDTYSNWRIFYHNEEYVYLILDGKLPTDVSLTKGTTVESLTAGETNYLELYEKFRVGDSAKYTLVDKEEPNSQAVAQLITDYANFGDTTESYKEYVVGAIGGPTIELLAAGLKTKLGTTMTLTTDTWGYKINNTTRLEVTSDGLYVTSDYQYWLTSPSAEHNGAVIDAGKGLIYTNYYLGTCGVRPVVCLKSSIPATVGTGDYNFELVK